MKRLRGDLIPAARFPSTTQVLVGGGPGQGVDFLHQAYTYFVPLIFAVLVLTYFLLMRAFRSLLLPLKAVLLNLLSVAAAYGMLVVFFRYGLGQDLFGLYQFAQVEGWIPIFLFAMLFGLSMDYEVFLVTRMREAWDEGADNATAVELGLEKTGRIITAAAIIMCAAFSGFVAGSIVGLQEFGLGLAVAIFVDATIVRCLLVPSMMAILDRWNWWLPPSLAKLVRVRPSPLESASEARGRPVARLASPRHEGAHLRRRLRDTARRADPRHEQAPAPRGPVADGLLPAPAAAARRGDARCCSSPASSMRATSSTCSATVTCRHGRPGSRCSSST